MSAAASNALVLEAVRELRVAEPDLGLKPLLAKLREQQPGLRACTKEVRMALKALESSAVAARAAALQPAADEDVPLADQEGGPNAAPSEVEIESWGSKCPPSPARKPAAATPHHPPSFLAASSPPCDASRARVMSAPLALLLCLSCPK